MLMESRFCCNKALQAAKIEKSMRGSHANPLPARESPALCDAGCNTTSRDNICGNSP
jgi:hypothetical protein